MSIQRQHTGTRMSQVVIHKDVVYLAGQVGIKGDSVTDQTRQILSQIDNLLTEAGSSNQHILQAIVWLADMADFEQMNTVWDAWVPAGYAPARACGEAKLAEPGYSVEIIITAALSE